MRGKRTGPNFFSDIKKPLIFIGRPLFNTVLVFLYTLIATTAILFKLSIHLIKLIKSLFGWLIIIVKKSPIAFSQSILKNLKRFKALIQNAVKFIPSGLARRKAIRFPKKKYSIIILTLTAFISLLTIAITTTIKSLPNPNKLITRDQIISTKIFDRKDKLLYKIYKNENRTLVQLEDIPPYVIEATIAIEDKDFYKHSGYSYTGILRALRQTIFEGKLHGGSTITQQLVKNALLTKEKTLKRKLKEIILAIIVETKFTKDEILTMYFNEVGYGGASYGVEEAAQMYFNKSVGELTLAEATLLAGLPVAPTYQSPFGTHPELAKFRQHEVLRRMVEEKFITPEEAEKTKQEKLTFSTNKSGIKAPHFVMFVKELLVEQFGEQMVEQGGLEVVTTLDLDIQNYTQKIVTQEVNALSQLNISNGAALITKPKTGEILAMVGSKDFFDFENDGQVNVTLRPRQPGSAIKPINYAVALENGFTAATIIEDSPITYQIPGQPDYSPKNYDNTFHGKITLREALANSYNVPAVKTLSVFGVDKMIKKGQQMGITTWKDKTKFGLSLTLGGGDVKMTDLAVAYGSLANYGKRVDLTPILKVSNYRGETLYQFPCQNLAQINFSNPLELEKKICGSQTVISPEIAFILSNILSDNNARSRAFGTHSVLNIPKHQVAVKTGTSQNLRDNWAIGYTKDILVATWIGNNDNSPMSFVASGITGASPIWNKTIKALLNPQKPHKFEAPETLVRKDVCTITGTLPCEGCPGKPEYFIKGTEPKRKCLLLIQTEENNNP